MQLTQDTPRLHPVRRRAAWHYAWWAAVGACAGLGMVSLLTIGIFLLAAAILLAYVGLRLGALRDAVLLAAVAGAGLPLLYVAWLNREGPGTVCHTSGSTTSCTELWAPWPWAVAGAGIVLAAVLLIVLLNRRQH
ncbi:hypothetical protein GCM10022237_02310 [Nocardioides ginsengisoli]|uniref:Uncharacterized protein n=1 Tax=Nocardioides ginsengisoli TaxID=363868 RepID=A0ABW3W343_9ACTN